MPTQPTTEEALTDEQLSELLQETERMYLSGQITSTDYREFLLRSMNQMVSMPPVPNAGMPSDMAARLDTVHHVLARQRALSGPGYHLTMTSLAVLMTLSELQVVKLMQRIWPLNGRLGVSFDLFAAQFQNLARIFLQSAAEDTKDSSPSSSAAEIERCLQRDQRRCILTDTPDPDVCYIVPRTSNNTADKTRKLYATTSALRILTERRQRELLLSAPGCSDRAWNMLCLSPTLHQWWSQGYFAIKCFAVTKEGEGAMAHLQLYWLPRQVPPREQQGYIPWDLEVPEDTFMRFVRNWKQRRRYGGRQPVTSRYIDNTIVATTHPANGRRLMTGDVFTVTVPSLDDGRKMQLMLDVQWMCLQVASMSSAAGDPRFFGEGDNHTEPAADTNQ